MCIYIYRYIYILYIVSSHHHLILFHLNVLNHHISSLHFFSAHSSSVTSLFFPSICSLPPTCFRATLSSSCVLSGTELIAAHLGLLIRCYLWQSFASLPCGRCGCLGPLEFTCAGLFHLFGSEWESINLLCMQSSLMVSMHELK